MKQSQETRQAFLQYLSEQSAQQIEDILNYFHFEYQWHGTKYITMKCPIHDGDNPTAFNMYIDNDVPCKWVCNTHRCHERPGISDNIMGFIMALCKKKNPNFNSYDKVIGWLVKQLNIKTDIINKNNNHNEFAQKNRAKKLDNSINPITNQVWSKNCLTSLIIPAQYYVKRNYSTNILRKYEVGLHKKHPRVFFPFYDESYKHIVGFSSRSIYEKCSKCKSHHNPLSECPSNKTKKDYQKWCHTNIDKKNILYNYWFAKPYLQQYKTAILVEGPGDVLRLEDNNIHCAVALLGLNISEGQRTLLEKAGVINLIVLLDNDDAGNKEKNKIEINYKRDFRMFFPTLISNDIGDGNEQDIQTIRTLLKEII